MYSPFSTITDIAPVSFQTFFSHVSILQQPVCCLWTYLFIVVYSVLWLASYSTLFCLWTFLFKVVYSVLGLASYSRLFCLWTCLFHNGLCCLWSLNVSVLRQPFAASGRVCPRAAAHAANRHVCYTEDRAASGLVYLAAALCCLWTCLSSSTLCCLCTCLLYRRLCCLWTCPFYSSLLLPLGASILQQTVLSLNVSVLQQPCLYSGRVSVLQQPWFKLATSGRVSVLLQDVLSLCCFWRYLFYCSLGCPRSLSPRQVFSVGVLQQLLNILYTASKQIRQKAAEASVGDTSRGSCGVDTSKLQRQHSCGRKATPNGSTAAVGQTRPKEARTALDDWHAQRQHITFYSLPISFLFACSDLFRFSFTSD